MKTRLLLLRPVAALAALLHPPPAPPLSPDYEKLQSDLDELIAENLTLSAENQRLLAERQSVEELTLALSEGRLDMQVRSNFVRLVAGVFGEHFVKEGGTNFLELEMRPHGPNIPAGFGSLLVTFQRRQGKTPGEVVAKWRKHWNRRARWTEPEAVQQGGFYLVLFDSSYEAFETQQWRIGMIHRVIPQDGPEGFRLSVRDLSETGNVTSWYDVFPEPDKRIKEIYELSDPQRPRLDYLPAEGKQFVINDEEGFRDAIMVNGDKFTVQRGIVCTLERQERVHRPGLFRWFIVPDGWDAENLTPPICFDDNGQEVPDYLAPLACLSGFPPSPTPPDLDYTKATANPE